MEDPTAGPPPSEKHYKGAVLSNASLQMISRDTPFLRCQADQQFVLLLRLSSPVLGEVEVGAKEAGQSG